MATPTGKSFQDFQRAIEIHRARERDRQRCLTITNEYIDAGRSVSEVKEKLAKGVASEDDYIAMMAELHPPEEEQIGEEVVKK